MRYGVLTERNFRRYLVGRAVSNVGDLVVPVAVAFAVLNEIRGSAGDLGLVLASESLPLIVFVLFGGALADRLSPRAVMIVADIVRGVVQLALASAIIMGELRLWHLVVGMLLQGVAQAAFHPASTRLLPLIVTPDRIQEANAILSVARNVSRIAGPTLAALLIAVSGVGTAFVLDGVTFVASFVSLALLPRALGVTGTQAMSMFSQIRTGWREFRSRRWVWSTVCYFGAYQALALAPYLVLGPVIANDHFNGARAWAVIVAASGAGAIVGGVVMVRLSPRYPLRFAYIVTFLEPPALILLGLVAPLWLIVVAWFIAGVTTSVWGVLWETALQEHIPLGSLGRVSAYDWFVSSAANPLSFALVGVVAAWVGAGTTLIVSGAILVGTTIILLSLPEVRRLGRRPADPATAL